MGPHHHHHEQNIEIWLQGMPAGKIHFRAEKVQGHAVVVMGTGQGAYMAVGMNGQSFGAPKVVVSQPAMGMQVGFNQ